MPDLTADDRARLKEIADRADVLVVKEAPRQRGRDSGEQVVSLQAALNRLHEAIELELELAATSSSGSTDAEESTYPLGCAPLGLDDGSDSHAPGQPHTEERKTNA
jgi:hypothetical protein